MKELKIFAVSKYFKSTATFEEPLNNNVMNHLKKIRKGP